jgi:hypothetical protein
MNEHPDPEARFRQPAQPACPPGRSASLTLSRLRARCNRVIDALRAAGQDVRVWTWPHDWPAIEATLARRD